MPGDLTPSEIRGRSFASSRRGFDRADVETFLNRVADEVADLQARLSAITDRLGQLGFDELPDAKAEFESVSADIGQMLEAARTAAQGMRDRAHADAAEFTSAAVRDAKALRTDAWEVGTELLQQAAAEGERQVTAAKEDALFIRAEAEQDALRLVTDARRQAEELVRSARQDAERARVDAHAESKAILDEARRAAEKAQERTRALESRRAELLNELERTRSAIGEVEAERTGRQVGPSGETSVRVIAGPNHAATHWPEDDGAVRIVPAVRSDDRDEVVDAEEMAAEVEQLRAAVLPQRAPEEEEPAVVEPEPMDEEAIDELEPSVTPEPGPEEPEPGPEEPPKEAAVPVAAEEQLEAEPAPVASVAVETGATGEPEAEPGAAPDRHLDALFAKLRQPSPEPEPPVVTDEAAPEAVTASPPPKPSAATTSRFELRDRMLLPIENRALRGLKRSIVELQNRVLDELRTSNGEWGLGRELVAETLGSDLDTMIQEAFLAGHTAVSEELGRGAPVVTGGPAQGAAEGFTADLHQAVQAALVRGRADPGSRRLASDVGRVFRSWRTDDAERHVRSAARHAFHDGLLAAYHRFGVAAVELVAPGRPCGECGAGTGIRWNPGEALPDGIVIPPAGRSCDAIVAPVPSDGSQANPEQ